MLVDGETSPRKPDSTIELWWQTEASPFIFFFDPCTFNHPSFGVTNPAWIISGSAGSKNRR